MNYLNLIVLLTQLRIIESPTFCLLFFLQELRKKKNDMGTEEEKKSVVKQFQDQYLLKVAGSDQYFLKVLVTLSPVTLSPVTLSLSASPSPQECPISQYKYIRQCIGKGDTPHLMLMSKVL